MNYKVQSNDGFLMTHDKGDAIGIYTKKFIKGEDPTLWVEEHIDVFQYMYLKFEMDDMEIHTPVSWLKQKLFNIEFRDVEDLLSYAKTMEWISILNGFNSKKSGTDIKYIPEDLWSDKCKVTVITEREHISSFNDIPRMELYFVK